MVYSYTKKMLNIAALALTLSCPYHQALAETYLPSKSSYLFYNGQIITMNDSQPSAEAVWIKGDIIMAVGTTSEVEEAIGKAGSDFTPINLNKGALLPGFIEPHAHISGTVEYALLSEHNIAPCLPERYQKQINQRDKSANCQLYVSNALEALSHTETINNWYLGLGLDPSRMSWNPQESSVDFNKTPAQHIEETIKNNNPVFILDQSGHLGYVNLEAFNSLGLCKEEGGSLVCNPKINPGKWEELTEKFVSGGVWVTGDDENFTGLIEEMEAMVPFITAILDQKNEVSLSHHTVGTLSNYGGSEFGSNEQVRSVIEDIAKTGVTTLVNGGALSKEEVQQVESLALDQINSPIMRYRNLLSVDYADTLYDGNIPEPGKWDESNSGLYALTGIKLWADGSTQGCTASLKAPYKGNCALAGTGHKNYNTPQAIENALRGYWKKGWYLNIHANGDQAIQDSLVALVSLDKETNYEGSKVNNPGPNTLIHATVGGNPLKEENLINTIAKLRDGIAGRPVNIQTSHLTGHIAYWGATLDSILDGTPLGGMGSNGRINLLDAMASEVKLNVPFSLHSDSPISPINPLWYVEQAVTRNTWLYPALTDDKAIKLPGNQGITVEQALKAITIVPARQHRMGKKLGSIEKGKVADLVILDKSPLRVDPNEIHTIEVLETFVSGHRNEWVNKEVLRQKK